MASNNDVRHDLLTHRESKPDCCHYSERSVSFAQTIERAEKFVCDDLFCLAQKKKGGATLPLADGLVLMRLSISPVGTY